MLINFSTSQSNLDPLYHRRSVLRLCRDPVRSWSDPERLEKMENKEIHKALLNILTRFRTVSFNNLNLNNFNENLYLCCRHFSSFDVRFTRGKTDSQPHHENLRKIQKFQKSEKNENNYKYLRCYFISPVHYWDNLSQLFCLSRFLENFFRRSASDEKVRESQTGTEAVPRDRAFRE